MGANKLKVTGFRIRDPKTLPKLDIIAEIHNRNRNQEVNNILEEYIKAYEAEHGEIIVGEEQETI